MRKVIVACALLVCPLAARGQNFVLTSPQAAQVNASSAPQIFVGAKNCGTEVLQFHWDLTNIGGLGTGQVINVVKARSSSTCGTTTVTAPDTITTAPSQTVTGQDSVTAAAMILDPDGGLPGGCNNTTTSSATPWTTFYCIQVGTSVAGGSVVFEDVQINYATAPPTTPTELTVQPGDSHLKAFWQVGNAAENISTYDVHVLPLDAGTPVNLANAAVPGVSNQTTADATRTDDGVPLVNGQTYNVLVVANDRYGNQSEPSGAVPGTPVEVLDFYGLYRTEGGNAQGGGGCSSAGAGVWVAILALLVGLAVRRHKKLRNGAARSIGGTMLIAFFALLAPPARAEVFPTTGYQRPPRFLLVAVKADRYDPKVDSEPGLTGSPYHQIFGGRIPLRWQLEVDWEFWHPFGSFMIGGTVGYWQNIGKGLVASTATTTGVKSDDTALLDVIPFGAVLTYRFDVLADMWPRFPVIPYGQIGLTRALWASFNGVGNVSPDPTGSGGHGSGWTWGYTTALGLALALDSLDPDLSREAYLDTGIQRTTIFAEYGWTRLDGFHSNSSLILTDRAWRFGLAMEF
jgi:hypothetical protein